MISEYNELLLLYYNNKPMGELGLAWGVGGVGGEISRFSELFFRFQSDPGSIQICS